MAVVSPIPLGLLAIAVGATVALTGSVTFPPVQVASSGLWGAPIRLPPLDETTTFAGVKFALDNYEWAPQNPPATKPESDLATTTTNKYKPELYGSGVRWWYKGETTNNTDGTVRTYPDLYVQQWSSSARKDRPALDPIGAPERTTWVVYSSLPLREPVATAATPTLALVAWTSDAGGNGVPPAGRVWSCMDPQGSATPRRLLFELTRVGQTTLEAASPLDMETTPAAS
jgi:hypothetical protein